MNQSKPIWHRIESRDGQRGESAEAYEAARLYFEMAANRSQEAVAQKLSKSRQLLGRWSTKWNWAERAAAYDQHLHDERERDLQRERALQAQRWIERDEQLREEFYQAGKEIVAKARKMISEFPERDVTRKENKDGKEIYLTIKTKHSLSGLSQLISIGAELQRLAVGINPGSSPLDGMDLSQFSSDDLAALKEGKPIKLKEKTDGGDQST